MKNLRQYLYSLSTLPSALFSALWFGLLSLPFTGLPGALYIAGAIIVIYALFRYLPKLLLLPPIILQQFPALVLRLKPISSLKPKALGDLGFFVLLIAVILLPFFTSPYVVDIAALAGIYIILSLGLNIMVGYTGLLNLGFAGFYAIGAYSYALLNTRLGIGFWESLPLSMVLSSLAGILIGIPALRLRGDYLAIVTLGFGEITRIVLNNWVTLTNGPNGITGIERPYIGSFELKGVTEYYYLVLLFVFLTALFIKKTIHSKAGRTWMAIRDDEIASTAMGINTFLYKLYAFSFGALWAGLAGQLFSAKMRFVSPESFTFFESVLIVAMVILGGQGTLLGPAIGAIILVALPELLREFQQYRMVFLGAGLIFMSIFRPQGIIGRRSTGSR
jgi:branched-chain amino acid transport system permease protein